jgi:hypothetical protein
MAEGQMTAFQIADQERKCTGTTWTRNKQFDKDGYLKVENLWDPKELYHPVPEIRGLLNYVGDDPTQFQHSDVENQVEGSCSRYSHPQYRKIHSGVRKKLEKILGRNLYNTYYYDRYYFSGQELHRHADRDACEISVTMHVSTNLPDDLKDWEIKIKTPDTYTDKTNQIVLIPGDEHTCILNPGDGMIYKGCERPHWRDPMPGTPKHMQTTKKGFFNRKIEEPIEYYYHQIFFHYVLADGQRAHCAWDRSR